MTFTAPCPVSHCTECRAENDHCCRCGEALLSAKATFALASGAFITCAWLVALVYGGVQVMKAVMSW